MMYTYNETENAVYMKTGYCDTDGEIILRAPVVNTVPRGFVKMTIQPKHMPFEIWHNEIYTEYISIEK